MLPTFLLTIPIRLEGAFSNQIGIYTGFRSDLLALNMERIGRSTEESLRYLEKGTQAQGGRRAEARAQRIFFFIPIVRN